MTHILLLLLKGTVVSMQIACVSLLVGLAGGIVVGILNSQRVAFFPLSQILRSVVWAVRGTPLFVQVLLAYYALPEVLGFSLSPFIAGVIALGLNATAYISEIVRGGINAIPLGQWEAAYVLGLSHQKTLTGIILPQMFRISWPPLTNELMTLIKETSILMIIGVPELTKISKDIVARELNPMAIYLMTAGLYLLLTSGVSFLANTLHKRRKI